MSAISSFKLQHTLQGLEGIVKKSPQTLNSSQSIPFLSEQGCQRISLQRASLDAPWGLSLRQEPNNTVSIAKVPSEPMYTPVNNQLPWPGDILVYVNDIPISSFGDFPRIIQFIRGLLQVHFCAYRPSPARAPVAHVVTPPGGHAVPTTAAMLQQQTLPDQLATSMYIYPTVPQNLFPAARSYTYTPKSPPPPPKYRNPLFQGDDGKDLLFCDNQDDITYYGYDGYLAEDQLGLFVRDIPNMPAWLQERKDQWKANYSWNIRKRQRLEQALLREEYIPVERFDEWLHVRKRQWRIQRRKRQRQRSEDTVPAAVPELQWIDKILQEEEAKGKKPSRPVLKDISFLFDVSLGLPDETMVHFLHYLPAKEHSKLLCLSHTTRTQLASRNHVWRAICPAWWTLPRRPRKPWHEIYLHKLRIEFEQSSKVWDDFLTNASSSLLKGDHLHMIQTLSSEAEAKSGRFSIDYTSGVVCERNSVLNLAVIHERQKVVRWLVEEKRADLESQDRGGFTPLLNAAWAGNKSLVRFLLSHGASRSKVGLYHYTKGIAPPDFEGLTAAGWAERKGHDDVAELIRLGL